MYTVKHIQSLKPIDIYIDHKKIVDASTVGAPTPGTLQIVVSKKKIQVKKLMTSNQKKIRDKNFKKIKRELKISNEVLLFIL